MNNSRRTPSLMSTASSTRSSDSRASMTPTSQGFKHQGAEIQEPSALLHDRLREKKARGRGASNTYSNGSAKTVHYGRDDGIFDDDNQNFTHVDGRLVQSSPAQPPRGRDTSRRASGLSSQDDKIRGMGAKEMTDYISTMHKQNFDLKLEVFHRRQRVAALEDKLEKYKNQQAENEELQEVNEQLVAELEKRDKAVEEAVGIICELEEKVEGLEQKLDLLQDQLADTRPSTAQPETECFTTDREDSMPPSSPPEPPRLQLETPVQSTLPTQTPVHTLIDLAIPSASKTPIRKPSFLTSKSGSHNALRSLYRVGEDTGIRLASSTRDSVLSDVRSEKDLDFMNSPRLSVLSESSFLSVYGDKEQKVMELLPPETDDKADDERGRDPNYGPDSAAPKQLKMARVNEWIGDRDMSSKLSGSPVTPGDQRRQFSSIEGVIQSPINPNVENPADDKERRREKWGRATVKQSPLHRPYESEPPSKGGQVFRPEILPPTPDTMTTIEMLPSQDHSPSSIIAEKSLLDGTPTPARSYSALKPMRRPRSSRKVVTKPSEEHMSEYEDDVQSSLAPIFPSPTDFNFTHLTDKTANASNLGHKFMFNGAEIAPSRPFRPANDRSHSEQLQKHATPSNPRSHLSRMETAPLSPNTWRSESSDTKTPRGQRYQTEYDGSPSNMRTTSISPTPHHNNKEPRPQTQQHDPQYRQASGSKLPLLHVRHARPATASAAARISGKKPSLKSRIFRRSNSHSSESPTAEQEPPPQQQAPIPMVKGKQRRPRPSSVYTAESLSGSKMARPGTAGSLGEKNKNVPAKASDGSETAAGKGNWNLPVVGGMGLGRSSSLRTGPSGKVGSQSGRRGV
ncbi:MAG: hypothetical protein M1836_002632 [Candelina mexicana]|nr:MAG: hypothetical protein M1836_002632 [Candelina mexicana]